MNTEKIIVFKDCCDGIYYHEFGSDNSTKSKYTINNYTMVQTGKEKSRTLPEKIFKSRIERGKSRKLLVGQ